MNIAVVTQNNKCFRMVKAILSREWSADFWHFYDLEQFNNETELDYDFLLIGNDEIALTQEKVIEQCVDACNRCNVEIIVWKDLSPDWLVSEIRKHDCAVFGRPDDAEADKTEDLSKVIFEREKIIEKVEVIREIYAPMPRIKAGIAGISSGAGATFITMNLAKAITGYGIMPAVLECGNADIFDKLHIKSRVRNFFSFYAAADEGCSIKHKWNKSEGINWVVKVPEQMHDQLENSLKILNALDDSVVLCDLSGIHDEEKFIAIAEGMDVLIAVIDPLPGKMMKGYKLLKRINSMDACIVNVVNKYNAGINRKEMLDFLELKELIYFPFVVPEDVYIAEYNCSIPYSISMIRQQIEEPAEEIIKKIIPGEFLKKLKTDRRKKVKNIFGFIREQ